MVKTEKIHIILAAAKIEEVVADYVSLKKSGSTYKGLSPFSKEKTPSFYVIPSKQIFKDFSSGKGGDVITFLKEIESFSFLEALAFLAKRYQITWSEEDEKTTYSDPADQTAVLYTLNEYAAHFFQQQLWETELGQKKAFSYLEQRGFSQETIRKFGLGYAPFDNAFVQKALNEGYRLELLQIASLAKEGEERDFFKDRVIFPIHSLSGRVLAFGARVLQAGQQPKYLNSKENVIYKKSEVLYGIFQAKNSIVKNKNCYLVEGYTDVLALHQVGIHNVVASAGTALTPGQIQLIKRYSSKITLLYDGDPAGMRAAFRGIDLLLEAGFELGIVVLPEGEDPDSFAKKNPPTQVFDFLENNVKDFLLFKIQFLLGEKEENPFEKSKKIQTILASIAQIPDALTQDLYLKKCSQLLEIDSDLLLKQFHLAVKNLSKNPSSSLVIPKDQRDAVIEEENYIPEELIFIKSLLLYGHYPVDEEKNWANYWIKELMADDLGVVHPDLKIIFEAFQQAVLQGEKLPKLSFFVHHSLEKIRKFCADFLVDPHQLSENWKRFQIYPVPIEKNLDEYGIWVLARLKYKKIQMRLEDLFQDLKAAEKTENATKINEILQEIQIFNQLKLHFGKFLGLSSPPPIDRLL